MTFNQSLYLSLERGGVCLIFTACIIINHRKPYVIKIGNENLHSQKKRSKGKEKEEGATSTTSVEIIGESTRNVEDRSFQDDIYDVDFDDDFSPPIIPNTSEASTSSSIQDIYTTKPIYLSKTSNLSGNSPLAHKENLILMFL